MPAKNRKLTHSKLLINGISYELQATTIKVNNETDDGETFYTHGGDEGTGVEEADPNWTLELAFKADWSLGGISDVLQLLDGQDVPCVVEHNIDIPAEHVGWQGTVHVKAPAAMGEIRTTDVTETTLKWLNRPEYFRP